MKTCIRYNLRVTGCSKQVSLFTSEICQKCLLDEKDKGNIPLNEKHYVQPYLNAFKYSLNPIKSIPTIEMLSRKEIANV